MDKEVQRVLWHSPIEYDALEHGPSYLPRKSTPKTASMFLNGSLTMVLATLQAAALVHQTNHWSTRGSTFYGDHLLFERLYSESQELIDQVAEKAIGSGEVAWIDVVELANVTAGIVVAMRASIPEAPDRASISLAAEAFVLDELKRTLDGYENEGKLTPGISNLLEGVADKHESFVYLLKQSSPNDYNYDRSNV